MPVASYEAGWRRLTQRTPARRPEAVVLGLPAQPDGHVEKILDQLLQRPYRDLATLILAQHAEPGIFDWVARRERTALLLWDDHEYCAEALEKLLAAPGPIASSACVDGACTDIRILLVDDARTVRLAYGRLLAKQGYQVETAANIEEALTLARCKPFDIAVIDYFMPGGNGDELCRRLREDPRTAGISTSILTGTYQESIIRDALAAGAVECMFKNEARELFLARIAAMSRSARSTRSIEAERQRLAGILNSVGDGVYGVNRLGQITFINEAGRKLLGYPNEEEMQGRYAHSLFHYAHEDGRPCPVEHCPLQQAYASGEALSGWQTVFWHRNGKPISVECTVYPLRVDGRLEGSVVAFRDITERKRLELELIWQANHDSLTRLCNRAYFERSLESELSRLKRSDEQAALLYIDLDRFKYINDTAGHVAGDQLLVEVAQLLHSRLRESDVLARLGGDEFAVILRNVNEETVQKAADSLREVLQQYTFAYAGRRYGINASIGVALIDRHTMSPGEALANADIACHIAKSRGRNQIHVYRPESDEKRTMHHELGWHARLQEALQHNRLRLWYQPVFAIAGRGVAGEQDGQRPGMPVAYHEVLVRFQGEEGPLVLPNVFLPIAERFGLMPQIDLWVLSRVVEEIAVRERQGRRVRFAVNISGQTLSHGEVTERIHRLLEAKRGVSKALILEITETSAIENISQVRELIERLRGLGCAFALDDFGSGFSSFHHLKFLPVDFVKIDGHFVRDIVRNEMDRAIVESVNNVVHALGKYTVAEFVEDRHVLERLRACGVDFAQGCYLAPPADSLLAESPEERPHGAAGSDEWQIR